MGFISLKKFIFVLHIFVQLQQHFNVFMLFVQIYIIVVEKNRWHKKHLWDPYLMMLAKQGLFRISEVRFPIIYHLLLT